MYLNIDVLACIPSLMRNFDSYLTKLVTIHARHKTVFSQVDDGVSRQRRALFRMISVDEHDLEDQSGPMRARDEEREGRGL